MISSFKKYCVFLFLQTVLSHFDLSRVFYTKWFLFPDGKKSLDYHLEKILGHDVIDIFRFFGKYLYTPHMLLARSAQKKYLQELESYRGMLFKYDLGYTVPRKCFPSKNLLLMEKFAHTFFLS